VLQVVNANAPTIASTVLTPTHESALATTDPVSVTGGAYAVNYLKSLTLTTDGAQIYTTAGRRTPSLTRCARRPGRRQPKPSRPADRRRGLTGAPDRLQPISVTVDTQAPSIAFDTTVLTTTHQLSFGRVELTGAAGDSVGMGRSHLSRRQHL
jgi:hypothetical protein